MFFVRAVGAGRAAIAASLRSVVATPPAGAVEWRVCLLLRLLQSTLPSTLRVAMLCGNTTATTSSSVSAHSAHHSKYNDLMVPDSANDWMMVLKVSVLGFTPWVFGFEKFLEDAGCLCVVPDDNAREDKGIEGAYGGGGVESRNDIKRRPAWSKSMMAWGAGRMAWGEDDGG
ncbi:hypothetical protein HU200_007586 [Digitaria exilis]|uniref:Uncharacterized protein n=1 Tax=Digitaria exilis TaxID=1010633 RepID=A0A835KPF7_9POAL|nr:hypothetical protein HU200_007586 [Digitaria exilis]